MLLAVSLSCRLFTRTSSDDASNAPAVDFVTPAKPLNVTVQLDKTHTASSKVLPTGGSVSLTAGDGSVFTLEVPAKALDADTMITMTAVKSIAGAPLGDGTPTAVQLEPSGLFFKEVVTLTILPAREIPVDKQIIFAYEGNGQDYHLAAVDPKSKDIKIRLMEFSGAGVGSGPDSAWAANLMIQASDASTRLWQKLGEATQTDRRSGLLGGESNLAGAMIESFFDQFYDQVVLKEVAAAELDCQFAQKASDDLIRLERMRQLLAGSQPDSIKTIGFAEKAIRLGEIGAKCKKAYHISGNIDDAVQQGDVCDSSVPFTVPGSLNFNFTPTSATKGTYTYTGPFGATGSGPYEIYDNGTMKVSGTGCIMGNCATYSHNWTATPIDPKTCGSK